MLQRVWLFFIFTAFIAAGWQVVFHQELDAFSQLFEAISQMAKLSVNIAIGLIGVFAFWLGIFNVAEKSGLINKIGPIVEPLFVRIMPDIPKGHPAIGSITMNMSANFLGLDNAATPFGIKAMKDMQTLNPSNDTLSDSQIIFLVLNTSSVTLFPIAVFLYRAEQGALVPTDVFIPILIATFCSTMTGLLITAWVQKINLIEKVLLLYLVTGFALVAAIVLYFLSISYSALATQSAFIANFLLLGFIVAILLFGVIKKINTYELFIDGAKQGFKLAIDLIPYLIAMLVAIGMLRQSGALGLVTDWIKSGVTFLGVDSRFVDLLPNGLMKPLSGSGARAMMIETMQHYGPDSFQGRLASIMQGSTETTFYILAVYLGAIGLKHTRYAVSCCLAADLSGIICAIAVCYWFFG